METPWVQRSARVPVRDDRSLRLGVVADTHSAPHAGCATRLAALRPDAILHAGDIGDPAVLDGLAAIAPVYAVRGNIDTRADALPDGVTLDLVEGDRLWLRVLLVHIGVNGPRLRSEVARRARAEGASLVICGHSHVPFVGRDGELTVFNPGSVGPRRFALPIVFGTIDITPSGARFAHVDCETGAPWRPR
jgi:putative phosphoesterase